MRFRIHFSAVLTALALCGAAFAQTKPETVVRKMRNIVAADAVAELKPLIKKRKLPVAVVGEPVSNSVMLAGDAASILKAADMLASLDKQPPTVLASIMVLEAPVEFAVEIGLGESTETNWVLTPRETRMLNSAIRLGKQHYGLEVLSRPQLSLVNNQSAAIAIKNTEGGDTMALSITPQFMKDVTLNIGAEFKRLTNGKAGEKIQATEKVADGGTLVFRGARTKNAVGGLRELLVVVSVDILKTPSDKHEREVLVPPPQAKTN
jgi:hypothetical protein